MRKQIISLSFALLSLHSWGKTVPATYSSMENLMVDVRDPYFQSSDRKKYLQHVQTQMQQKLAQEINVSPEKLSQSFVADQKKMNLLWAPGWIELQTEFYTTLHQEIFYQRWLTKTKDKKITEYGKNIFDAMMIQLGKYSGVKEGRLYNRWNDISVTKNGKSTNYRVPFFIFSKDTHSLLQIDAHTSYEYLFPKENQASIGNPSLTTFLKTTENKSRQKNQILAEKIQLNHRIYIRAVANGAKTVASVHYLTGEYSLDQTETKVSAFLEGFCDGCSSKEKEDYKSSALTYVKSTKKTFAQNYYSGKDVVNSFCSDLKNNLYMFDEPAKKKAPVDPYTGREVYVAVQDNTRVDMSHIYAQMAMQKIQAISKTIQEHDLGVLFLTNSLTILTSDHKPLGTTLGCRPETIDRDAKALRRAINEARVNVEQYISHINQKINNSTISLKAANETLEYFTQTNVSATTEALMTFPQGINHALNSVLELDGDARRRKNIDKMVTWGGTIIGVALTVSGIGAPEGVAILLTVAAMTKGIISGTYNLYRAQQEKAFYRELTKARIGLGNNFYLDNNMAKHYNDYRNLRISYIMDFAGAIFSFAKLHKMALTQSAGSIPKANSLIQKCMKFLTSSGKDITEDQLSNAILQAAVN
jgi:hypothetical protein